MAGATACEELDVTGCYGVAAGLVSSQHELLTLYHMLTLFIMVSAISRCIWTGPLPAFLAEPASLGCAQQQAPSC